MLQRRYGGDAPLSNAAKRVFLDQNRAVVNERLRDICPHFQHSVVRGDLVMAVGLSCKMQKQIAVPAPVDIDKHATAGPKARSAAQVPALVPLIELPLNPQRLFGCKRGEPTSASAAVLREACERAAEPPCCPVWACGTTRPYRSSNRSPQALASPASTPRSTPSGRPGRHRQPQAVS